MQRVLKPCLRFSAFLPQNSMHKIYHICYNFGLWPGRRGEELYTAHLQTCLCVCRCSQTSVDNAGDFNLTATCSPRPLFELVRLPLRYRADGRAKDPTPGIPPPVSTWGSGYRPASQRSGRSGIQQSDPPWAGCLIIFDLLPAPRLLFRNND